MAYGQKLFNSIILEIKIFKKILTENALEYLALWRDFLGIALQARIFGAARVEWERAFTMPSRDKNNLKVHPNYNLKDNL